MFYLFSDGSGDSDGSGKSNGSGDTAEVGKLTKLVQL
jgi:hypothetical protein